MEPIEGHERAVDGALLAEQWGKRIRRIRREKELTVTAVAKDADITRQYLNAIERGQYAPSVKVRLRIAEAISADPNELFSYDLADAS